jgi:hypothetical protein
MKDVWCVRAGSGAYAKQFVSDGCRTSQILDNRRSNGNSV